jgi:threonine/homoserine/homoserine lactone efflux protein
MSGIAAGFFLVQLMCAALAALLSSFLAAAGIWIRIAGALYILYLAVHLLRARYDVEASGEFEGRLSGSENRRLFIRGVLLQLVNPKGIIYGLSVYSIFLVNILGGLTAALMFPPLLAFLSFLSVSCWALFGSVIGRHLGNGIVRSAFNLFFFLLLCYVAFDMIFG